jgi:hypothetical protein
MKARKLIADAIYDPDEINAVGKAIDNAWEQVGPQVGKRPEAIEAARLKLAEIVLRLTNDGTRDPQQLTEEAVKVMLANPTELK